MASRSRGAQQTGTNGGIQPSRGRVHYSNSLSHAGSILQLDNRTQVCGDLLEALRRVRQLGTGKILIVGARLKSGAASATVFGLPGKTPEFSWKDDGLNGIYTVEFKSGAMSYKTIPGWSARDWMESGVQRIVAAIV